MAVKGRKALIHRLQKLLNIASETAEKAIVVQYIQYIVVVSSNSMSG